MRTALFVLLIALLAPGVNAQLTEAQRQADQHFRTAFTAFEQKTYANAREGFERALATEALPLERRMEALYYRAISALELFHADAESLMQSFIEEFPTSSFVNQARLYLGQFFFKNRNYRKSETYLSSVNARYIERGNRQELRFQLGYSHFANEHYDEARSIFSTLKNEDGPFAASARYYFAHILYANEDYPEALVNFEALQNDPAFGKMVPFYLAHVYYQMKEYDSLFIHGEAILSNEEAPRRVEIAKLMGDAHYRQENYAKAIVYFELFREEGGRPTRNDHYELGFSYYKTGDFERAIEHFNKVSMNKDALAQMTYYHLGDCYLRRGDKQSALTAFSAAMDIDKNPEIAEDAAFQFVKLNYELGGVYRDVVTALNQFQRKYPNSEHSRKINTLLADAHLRSKNYSRAAEALKRAGLRTIEQQSIYQKVTYFQGIEAFQQERYKSAVVHFAESRKHPIDQKFLALSLYWAAESFFQLMEYDAAVGAYLEFQQSPQAYSTDEFMLSNYGLGYAHYMAGNLPEAANAFRRFSRERNVNNRQRRDGLLRLADVYFLQGQFPQALEFYSRVNDEFTEPNTYAHFQKALCLGLTNEPRKKIAELESLIKRAPNSPLALDARFEKASTFIQLDEYDQALRIYKAFIHEHPNHPNVPRAKLNMSLAYRNSMRYNDAINTLKEIAEMYPNTPESQEAISFGQNVFSEADRMADYVSWVQDIGGGNVEQGKLDSALYFSAFDHYSTGNYQAAIRGFNDYEERFPSGLFRIAAKFYQAESHQRINEFDKAIEGYEEVLTNERTAFFERALLRSADLLYQKEDYVQSGHYYRQILNRDLMEDDALLATERMMRISFKLADWPQLEDWTNRVLKQNPKQAKLKRDALWYRALALHQQSRRPEADSALAHIVDKFQGSEAASARYFLAEYAFDDNELELTKTRVYALIEAFPNEVELRDRGLLLLAKVFIEEDDLFQAEYSLDFVIQSNTNKELVDQATQLKAVLEDLRSAAEASDNDAWEVTPGGDTPPSIIEDSLTDEDSQDDDAENINQRED
ncbi:MAG: tetratricopeptide repeat protein [Cryomorphaceae bacterium]|nr:tetratricopeptide repeat protein [Cryomorphaceae bacterium]